jgi:ubiquinone/menaquinone biosynthesis C-methylase UbiE
MIEITDSVRAHYQAAIVDKEDLLAKIDHMIDAMGDAPLTADRLARLDQFRFGGLAATAAFAKRVGIVEGSRVLDAGAGLGGPSRYLAETYNCEVYGVDLAPHYVAIAELLAKRAGLAEKVRYSVGDLAHLVFESASFDLVWTQHVVMNIKDRVRVYGEFRRMLKPGGRFAFYDVIASDGGAPPLYPVPWAESAETSTLLTEAQTRVALETVGLKVVRWDDVIQEAFGWMAEQRQAAPLAVNPGAVVGLRMAEMVGNFGRNLK